VKTSRDGLFLGWVMCVVCLWCVSVYATDISEITEALPTNHSVSCSVAGQLIAVTNSWNTNSVIGYVVDPAPQWELTVNVVSNAVKIPMQPGLRKLYVESVTNVFSGQPEIGADYFFTFVWNSVTTGKREIENLKGTRQ
jgi:hypothetical protein